MVDRALVFYEISVWGTLDYFREGTLLDGELAWNFVAGQAQQTMTYCVFDIIASAGRYVADKPFAVRLQVILECVLPHPTSDEGGKALELRVQDERKVVCVHREPTIVFAPKSFHPSSHVASLWRKAGTHGQRTDRLLFTDRSAPMVVGKTDCILKWKPHHTIDVALKRSGDKMSALVDTFVRRKRTTRKACKTVVEDGEATRVSLAEELDLSAVQVVSNKLTDAITGDAENVYECAVVEKTNESVTLFPMRSRPTGQTSASDTIRSTIALQVVTLQELSPGELNMLTFVRTL